MTGQGWRNSRTKILDNALIGFCKIELDGERPGTAARVNQITFEVPGYPPANNEAKSMISGDHPYLNRMLQLLEAALPGPRGAELRADR